VSVAPQSREVEHLEGKVITKCLNQKEMASKAVARVQIEIQKDDDKTVGTGIELLEAPDHVKEWAKLLEGLPRNNAIIVLEDGSNTDAIGASKIGKALEETKGAQGLVFAGKVTDKIFDYASGAGIENVLGNSRGSVSRKQDVQAFSPEDF
jgi:hypothetical protein